MLLYREARVISNTIIGDHVCHLIVRGNSLMPFEAGQFFLLRLPNDRKEYVERSYSVANYSNGDIFEFIIRIKPQGQMTNLISRLKKGELIDMKGPFGKFGFATELKKIDRLILIAGGVGVAPFRSMIQKSFLNKEQYFIQLFYSFRNSSDFLFQKEWSALKNIKRFRLISTIGEALITDVLGKEILQPEEGTHVFICGPPLMVKAAREKIFALNFSHDHVHLEAW